MNSPIQDRLEALLLLASGVDQLMRPEPRHARALVELSGEDELACLILGGATVQVRGE